MIIRDCHTSCDHKLDFPHHTIRPTLVVRRRAEDGKLITVEETMPDMYVCARCECMVGAFRPRCPCACHYSY